MNNLIKDDPSRSSVSVSKRLLARIIDFMIYIVVGMGFLLSVFWFPYTGARAILISVGGEDVYPPVPPSLWIESYIVPDVDPWALIFFLHFVAATCVLVPAFLYEILLTSTRGQTIGKMLTKIKVVSTDNGSLNLGWKKSSIRWAVLYLPILVPIIGIPIVLLIAISPLFDRKRRGWHDKLAGTMIVLSSTDHPSEYRREHTTGTRRRILARTIDWILYPIVNVALLIYLIELLGLEGSTFIAIFSNDLLNPIEPLVVTYELWLWLTSDLWFAIIWLYVLAIGLMSILLYELPLTAVQGQTVGKILTKNKVVRIDNGQVPGWKRASVRWIVLYLPLLILPVIGIPIFLLTALSPLIDTQRRGWHDKLAGTMVVPGA